MTVQRHYSPYAHAPKIFGLNFKVASRAMLVFEAILAKLLLVISICSIIYSPTWYPVFVNFAFLIFIIFAIVTYNKALSNVEQVYAYPMLSFHITFMFWTCIWLYASLNSIATGAMWSLEWLGGPKTSRQRVSHDIKDDNYANPNETHPETSKAIKYGAIISAVCLLILTLKVFSFIIARRTFFQIRAMKQPKPAAEEHETASEISNVGGSSPIFPVAFRNRPPKMSPLEEVLIEEYPPTPEMNQKRRMGRFEESTC